MIKRLLVGLIVLLVSVQSYGQIRTCAQTLRLVRSTYEQGRFHEIPTLLEGCLSSGFNTQEKIEALKILTLSYLYREEPNLADESMLRLLNTDHFFTVNENIDPAEFTALYYTFRTKPLFAIGVKFGANSTFATPINNFYVGGSSANKGEYSPQFNIQFGVSFEKHLFEKKNSNSRWTAAPEILLTSHNFSYANESLTISDQTGAAYSFIDGVFSQSRLDLNLLAQYKLKESLINPYATFGAGVSYLLNGSAQLETQFPFEGSVVTGPSIDIKDTFKPIDIAAVVGFGVKYKFGEIYLNADIRYKYGLTNITKESARSNPEATFDYGFVSNDLTQSSVLVNIGFVWPYFNPKKLLK